MSKRIFKKFVAALALVAMLAETGYEDYSMVVNTYAAEEADNGIEVIDVEAPSEVTSDAEVMEEPETVSEPAADISEEPVISVESAAEDINESADAVYIEPVSDTDAADMSVQDALLADPQTVAGETSDEISSDIGEAYKNICDDRFEAAGYDDLTLHVVTGQMNTEDSYRLLIYGPSSMEYESILDNAMGKSDQGTYFIEKINKEEFKIEVDAAEGMTYKFRELDNGDIELELISAPEPEIEKILDVHPGSISGSGYDSLTISLDTNALKKDTQFFSLYVVTDADASYEGYLIDGSRISSLSNTADTIRIDDLDKKEFSIYVESDDADKNIISAEFSIQSIENGIVNALIELDKAEQTKRVYTYEDDRVSVTATLEVVDAIPDDADFVVKPVTASTSGYNYDAYMQALNDNADSITDEAAADSDELLFNDDNTLLYDIAFFAYDDDDNYVEIQPEEGSVRISIQFKNGQLEDELGATENADVTVIHMPLAEAVKESVDSTEDATNISSGDIKIEVVAESASVEGESSSFTLSDFSLIAVWANGKLKINPGPDVTYESALGNARFYGVTANTINVVGHMETNFATGTLSGNAGINSCKNEGGSGGETYIGEYTGSGFTMDPAGTSSDKDIVIYTTPEAYKKMGVNMTNGRNHVVVNTTKYSESDIKNKVSALVSAAQANCDNIAYNATNASNSAGTGYGYNFLKAAYAPYASGHPSSDSDKWYLDISECESGTYYFNFEPGEFSSIGHYVVKLKSDQRIVFNIPDSEVSFKQFTYVLDGTSYTTSGDARDDVICQRMIFNCPNAKTAYTSGPTAGCFLVPYADFATKAVAAGWVVANTISAIGGQEWHCVWHDMPEPDPVSCSFAIKGIKTVDGRTPSANEVFTFGLYDMDWNPVIGEDGNAITAQNDASGVFTFPEIKYSGDYRGHIQGNNADTQAFEYYVKEIPGEDGSYSYTEDYYKIVVYVHTNSDRANDVKAVRGEKYDSATGTWSQLNNNAWNLFDTTNYVAFDNGTITTVPADLDIAVNKTFEGDWDDNTKVNVTIEKFSAAGIEEVPDSVWDQITNKSVTLTKNNPSASFGKITFDADYKNGYDPVSGTSPEGTVKYHVYMFKITEDLATKDPSVDNDVAENLGYSVTQKGVRYLKVFVNTVTNDNHTYEAKITAQVKGNTNVNTAADSCQPYGGAVEFVNRRNTGEINLVKKDADSKKALSGVEFYLYTSDNKPVKVTSDGASSSYKMAATDGDFAMLTDADGSISVTGLTAGSYYFKETGALTGYEDLTDIKFAFEVNNSGEIVNKTTANDSVFTFASAGSASAAAYTILNTPKKGSVVIEKVSSAGAALSGVKFDLYKDGTVIATLTTGADGKASKSDLTWGSYVLKEQANPGYVPNTNEYKFTIDGDDLNASFTGDDKIVNTPIEGSFKLIKVADKKPLAGAIFSLKKGNTVISVKEISDGNYEYAQEGTTQLVTNSEGVINVTKLPYGEYEIVEVSAPTGYVISSAYTKTFKIENNGDDKQITVTNDKVSASVKFVKADEDTSKALAGAEFTLTGKRAGSNEMETFGTVTTAADGIVSFEGLGCGTYTVKETKAPAGYVYDEADPLTISFEITEADNGKVIFLNKDGRTDSLDKATVTNKEEDGRVTIRKQSDKGTPLSGVIFELYTKDGKGVVASGDSGAYTYDRVASFNKTKLTTDANGEITVTKLPWGSYYFKEISTVAGFVADTASTYEFTIGSNNLTDTTYTGANAIVNDTVKGYVKLIKVDEDDKDDTKLSGVEFDLYKADGTTIEKAGLKTDEQGVITYGPVEYGTYYFKEKSTIAGYTLTNGEALKVQVTTPSADINSIAAEATVTATNERKLGQITLTKTDAATEALLDGAEFELYSTNGEGVIKTVSKWLNNGYTKYGTYTVTNGSLTVKDLPWGKYKFKEVKAPKGYVLPEGDAAWTKEVFIGVSENTEKLTVTLDVTNDQQLGRIKLVKSDAKDSARKLNGGEFELYNAGGRYGTEVYSLTDGEITVENLPFGEYYFVETKAPEGYVTPTGDAAKSTVAALTAESVEASVKTPVSAALSNTEITGGFELHKVDGTKALSGATFTLWADNAKKTQIKTSGSGGVYAYNKDGSIEAMPTDAEGVLKVTGLPYGTYYIFEEAAPAGYMPNTEGVPVNVSENNAVIPVNFTNSLIKAGVTFTKVEQDVNGYTVLDGAQFELFLKDENGELTSMGAVGGINGVFTRTELGAGSYVIKETKAPTGYEANTKEYTFTIAAADNGKIKNLDNPDVTVGDKSYIINKRTEGKAKLKKVGSDTNGAGLAGAVFDLYEKGASAAYKTGLVSDEEGYVTAEKLPWGEYYFVESKAPKGYAKDETHYEFTIDAEHTDVTLTKNAVNTYILGQAELKKCAWDTKNDKATGKALEGAVFDLYVVADGKDMIVEGYESGLTSGEDGYVRTAKDLPVGSYYFLERTAPKGYKASTTKFEFSVTDENYEKIITPTQDAGIAYNKPELGKVKLYKYETVSKDGKTEKAGLSGVTFELYQKSDLLWGLISTDKKLGEYTSDAGGIVTAEGLDWGEYYFVEKEAPEGYEANTTKVSFTIDKDCQDIDLDNQGQYKCSLENKRINGSIKLVKSDSEDTSKLLSGAAFKLHKVEGAADTVIANVNDTANGYFTTDENGVITVNNLEWAAYYFEEVKAPEGYVTPTGSAAYTATVYVDAKHTSETIDASRTISFTNGYAYGNVQITKTDDNMNPLSGAEFKLYAYADGAKGAQINVTGSDGVYAYSEAPTDVVMTSPASGVVKVTGLPYGTYAFVEAKAPAGYVRRIDDIIVKVTENQSADEAALEAGSASCVNGTLSANAKLYKAYKTTDGTKRALKGAEFKLYMDGLDDALSTQYSDENGEVLFTGLTEGSYTVRETAAPNNAYKLYDGELKFTVTHDDDGKTIEINTKDTPVVNEPIKGSAALIKHYKVAQEVAGTLSGVTFDLYKGAKDESGTIAYADNPYVSKVTDANGRVEFTDLDWGYYVIRENKTNLPAGYVGTDEEFAFEINADTLATKREYDAYNSRISGELELEKIDKTSREALKGAETTFSLVGYAEDAADGAKPIYQGTYTVSEDGRLSVKDLPWGNYTLKELKAQEGYVCDGKEYKFTINGGNLKQSYTADKAIENLRITGSVELEKVDSKTKKPMSGVVFKLYKDEEPDKGLYKDDEHLDGQFTTDEKGKLSISGLEYGWYHFEEVTPNGYKELTNEQLSKLKFQIKEDGQNVSLTGNSKVENTPSDGKVKLVKKDDTGINPVSGAKFSLYGSDPETFGQTVSTLFNDGYYYIGTYTTNADGEIVVDKLPWQNYYFVEKDKDGNSGIPAGYSSDDPDKKYEFTIDAANSIKELSYTLNVTNDKLSGSILLTKVDPNKSEGGKDYTLSGAKFKLYKVVDEGDDVDITSTLKECVDGVLITDANGQIKIDDVGWGDYYFVEVEAPVGYDLVKEADGSAKKYPVSISAKNWNASTKMMEVQTAKVVNSEIYGYVKLAKRLIDTNGEVIDVNDRDLSGIEFAILSSDGKTVVAENLKTDKEGRISAELIGKLPFGTYYFKEVSVPASLGSFPKNDSLLPFVIDKTNTADTAVEYTFDNSEVLGGAKIKKTDATSGAGVKGIKFDLYYADGTLKGSYTTDESGWATAEGLSLGGYYFVENEESAEKLGYTWNDARTEFEITTEDKNAVKDLGVIENERMTGSITLKKLGRSSSEIENTILLNKDCTARFELYREGKSEPVKTADELYELYNDEGVVQVTGLEWGKYYFKEVAAPKGYVLPDNSVSNTVEINGASIAASVAMPLTASITDDTIRVNVSKVEVGGTAEIPGAKMQILKADAAGNAVEGAAPVIEWTSGNEPKLLEIGTDFEGLVPGVNYVLHEDVSPAGYALTKDIAFTVDEKGNVITDGRKEQSASGVWTIFVEDELINVYIDKKALGETANVTLKGAQLEVRDGDTVIDSWTTLGETHKIKADSSNPLVIGKEYTLAETSAPKGYYTAEPITFKILDDGRIQIIKDASGMATAVDKYQPTDSEGKNQKLVGSTLTMFDRPIKLVVSKKRLSGSALDYVKGATLALYTYDNDVKGAAAIYTWETSGAEDEIPYGILEVGHKYIIEETVAPAGYALLDKPVVFTVNDFDPDKRTDENQLIPQSVDVFDELLKIEVSKKAITADGAELPGAGLKIVDAAGETVAEWTSADVSTVMTTLSESELSESEKATYAGHNVIYGVNFEEGKTYTLVETKAPYGYAIAKDVKFTIKNGKPDTADGTVSMIDTKDVDFYTHIDGTKKWILYRDENGVIIPNKTYADVTISLLQNGNPKIDLDGDGKGDKEFNVTIENGAQASDGKATFVFGVDENGNDILPIKDASGNDYVYTVRESGIGEYDPVINMAGFNAVITNTPIVDPFKIKGEKEWVDPEGSMHPDIKIQLWRDGKFFKETELTATQTSAGVKYTFEFDPLWEYNFGKGEGESLADADGHKFKYEIKEVGATGYVLSADMNGTKTTVVPEPVDGVVNCKLTNTIEQEYVQVRGTKHWDDMGDASKRPAIKVNLYATDSVRDKVLVDTIDLPNTATSYAFGVDGRVKLPKYDDNGQIIEYTIGETVPEGFGYTSEIIGNDIYNTPSRVRITKTDAATDDELPGALMALYDADGNEVERWRSTSSAHYVEGLVPGDTYTLRELEAPAGYVKASDITFTVNENGVEQPVEMVDPRITGSVTLTKKDAETRDNISGAVFNLYTASGALVNVVGSTGYYEYYDGSASTSLSVGSAGTLTVTGLPYGEYYFREVSAPSGYALSSEAAYFTIASDAASVDVTYLNTKLTGRARLAKADTTTGASLAGAVFELYSKTPRTAGQAIGGTLYSDVYYLYGTYVTDADGRIDISGLPWDDYYFIETIAPDGHVLNMDTTGDPLVYVFTVDGTTVSDFAVDLGTITNDSDGGGGGGGTGGGSSGSGVAGVRSLKGGVASGVLGVRAKPTSGVLGVRVGPTTGDAANIALWLALLLASISIVVAICVQAGKKKKAGKIMLK